MDISLDCIPCIVQGYTRLLRAGTLPEEAGEPGMRRLLDYLARVDYRQSPPGSLPAYQGRCQPYDAGPLCRIRGLGRRIW